MQTISEHSATHIQGRKVKYSNRSNSAADCSIALKFDIEFDHGEAGLLYMFKVKGHRSRSRGQSSRSQRNVTYQQEKRSKTVTDRLSDFKLGTGDELKRIGLVRRRAASSCNAFAIATFSSCLHVLSESFSADVHADSIPSQRNLIPTTSQHSVINIISSRSRSSSGMSGS